MSHLIINHYLCLHRRNICNTIYCTRKWIGNTVQNFSSSSVRSRDKIVRVISSSLLDRVLVNFYHSTKFAEMLLENNVAFMLLSLHPNIIVHVENVVSLFSSPSTSSQKVRKCSSHNFLSQVI